MRTSLGAFSLDFTDFALLAVVLAGAAIIIYLVRSRPRKKRQKTPSLRRPRSAGSTVVHPKVRTQRAARRRPAPRAKTAELQRTTEGDDDGAEAIAALLLLVGGAWLVSKVVKTGFAFLKEVDWDDVAGGVKSAIEQATVEIERQPSAIARLDRAEQLLTSGGEINVDQAAMLTSATVELGLRTLANRYDVVVNSDDNSLAGLAIRLGESGYLTPQEQRQFQQYAFRIRNRVMHGELGVMNAQEVTAFVQASRRLFAAHDIA
jgi:hypothetical protein